MYTQADREEAGRLLRRRWMIVAFPCAVLFAAGIALFVVCQLNRIEWGWIVTAAATIAAGGALIFFDGVYIRPMRLYKKHVGFMLDGRMRETSGILQEVSQEVCDKDGIDSYSLIVNVGARNDPEDERLFYFDAQKGRPSMPVGTRVLVKSNDKMISALTQTV